MPSTYMHVDAFPWNIIYILTIGSSALAYQLPVENEIYMKGIFFLYFLLEKMWFNSQLSSH